MLAFIGILPSTTGRNSIKNRIKVERAEKNFTQEELATQIGVSRQTIHAIEAGKYVLSTVLALKIAQLFNKSVEQLFTLEPTA